MTPQYSSSSDDGAPRIPVRTTDCFAVVVSRYNQEITQRLLDGALATFRRYEFPEIQIRIEWVPGAFELPLAALRLAESGRFAGVVCLGAVIQGETSHHDYINHQVAAGIMQAGLTTGVPAAFGVLTCQTWELALDRAGGKSGNKGIEAACAVLEMAHLLRSFGS